MPKTLIITESNCKGWRELMASWSWYGPTEEFQTNSSGINDAAPTCWRSKWVPLTTGWASEHLQPLQLPWTSLWTQCLFGKPKYPCKSNGWPPLPHPINPLIWDISCPGHGCSHSRSCVPSIPWSQYRRAAWQQDQLGGSWEGLKWGIRDNPSLISSFSKLPIMEV